MNFKWLYEVLIKYRISKLVGREIYWSDNLRTILIEGDKSSEIIRKYFIGDK